MCGRYPLFKKLDDIQKFLNAEDITQHEIKPTYNAPPSSIMPVAYETDDRSRIIDRLYWGFMKWQPEPGKKPFTQPNAKDSSVAKKSMWKKAFLQNRCIVPANGFFEWHGKKGNKTPHYIFPKDDDFFGLAGIYSDLSPDESASKSYSIITTSPNKLMENIHNRMPVILHPSEFNDWLDPDNNDPDYLQDFLKPYPDDAMEEYIVPKAVGNVKNNHAGLIEKADLFG